ncbi:MAG TPA: GTPase HflX, partial [Geobacteraceae bacterium]|nr:GTPase HflX [Geobacteraceae bacterium]
QDADLLLHLVDCVGSRFEEQITQVEQILGELGLADKPRLLVFNKADRLPEMKGRNPLTFMKVRQLARRLGAILVSALDEKSLGPLLAEMERRFWSV